MRNAFIKTLGELAQKDKRIMLIVGDLGFGVIEDFQKQFPSQFLNAGVAEQNMTGMAAGLALSGNIVFTYSIGNFPILRPLEQVRLDICYHNANVKIVTVGGGFAYGALGSTHHATEDLAIMRALPNMTVVAPGDPIETDLALRALVRHEGPVYLRLNRAGDRIVHTKKPSFILGKAITVQRGKDITLVSTGAMLSVVIETAKALDKEGISCRVLSMHTLKPLDDKTVLDAAKETRALLTIEEHSILGGLGGAVAEVLAEHRISLPFLRIGIPDTFSEHVGNQDYLRQKYGLSKDRIIAEAKKLLSF